MPSTGSKCLTSQAGKVAALLDVAEQRFLNAAQAEADRGNVTAAAVETGAAA